MLQCKDYNCNMSSSPIHLTLVTFIALTSFFAIRISGHGRLLEPPGRSSMWRFKEFATQNPPQNYNDNQLYCGGFYRMFKINGGRCGPCGDPFDDKMPRENENGGKYGRGILVREYKMGQPIDVTVQLTTSHKGYFQFRICNYKDPTIPEKQPCFNQNVLQLRDGTGTKFPITVARTSVDVFKIPLQLPSNLTCQRCILQWHYRTGNSWGKCTNGTSAMGCGNQEVFRACADIIIS